MRKDKVEVVLDFGRPVDIELPLSFPSAVFGVSIEESLEVIEIACLLAVNFRCIQYLETTKLTRWRVSIAWVGASL